PFAAFVRILRTQWTPDLSRAICSTPRTKLREASSFLHAHRPTGSVRHARKKCCQAKRPSGWTIGPDFGARANDTADHSWGDDPRRLADFPIYVTRPFSAALRCGNVAKFGVGADRVNGRHRDLLASKLDAHCLGQ